jgi:hypothetical protein
VTSNTQRSLKTLRALGYEVAIVEKFNSHAGPYGQRFDLFGLADLEALAPDHTLYVQCCSQSTGAAHLTKCLAEKRLSCLVACPQRRFEVWCWAKRGARGKRKLWTVRRHRAVRVWSGIDFVPQAVMVSETGEAE